MTSTPQSMKNKLTNKLIFIGNKDSLNKFATQVLFHISFTRASF